MDTVTTLTKGIETNKNWFEVWSIEADGSLKTCVNFYDIAFENVAAWVANCLRLESDRTDEDLVVVHAYQDEKNETVRDIMPVNSDASIFQTVKKFRSTLIKN
jgi:hypothetical protein